MKAKTRRSWDDLGVELCVVFLMLPFRALLAMVACRILHDAGFPVPAVGYWSSFMVAIAFGLGAGAAGITRERIER